MKINLVRAMISIAIPVLAGSLICLQGCSSGNGATTSKFLQTNLVSDIASVAAVTDPDLINPWGIAFSPTGPFWIADNNSGKATLYNSTGVKQGLVVNIPTPSASTGGAPTGQVYNGTTDFTLANGSAAVFIFSTEDGTIVAWNGGSGTQAVVKADRSAVPSAANGAVYKGLAIGSNATGNFLYATNFRAGTVDVFDKNYSFTTLAGSFADAGVPAGFAPFGIANIGGDIYVTYAKQSADKHDDVEGTGNGIIDVFDTNGNFKRRFATGSAVGGSLTTLDSPWGVVAAPANFGSFGSALLVGNFGDGHISAFNLSTGASMGQLNSTTGINPVVIPGLWGLAFGNGSNAGAANTLFFTAGIGDAPTFLNNREKHGLFGALTPTP